MNPANLLTILRILLIPVFVYAYYRVSPAIAFIVFLSASATDWLDGYLARRLNIVTALGKLLDPLADKLMLLTALYCLADTHCVPWWVFGALTAKEGAMMLGALFMLEKRVVVYSNIFGKISTVLFIAAIACSIPVREAAPLKQIGQVLLYAALVSSFVAMGVYARNMLTGRYAAEDEGEVKK